MTPINLIPKARQQRRQCRRLVRTWTVVAGAYMAVLAIVLVTTRVSDSHEDGSVRSELVRVNADLALGEGSLAKLREDLVRETALLNANLEIADQPDWSVLLALLAESTGNTVVLRRCQLSPSSGSRVGRSPAGDGSGSMDVTDHFVVQLDGMGRTQEDVSNFVLRLEDVPIFGDVTLQDTRREPFFDGNVVAFRLDLALGDEGGTMDE